MPTFPLRSSEMYDTGAGIVSAERPPRTAL
jgi:hypothetical protein